MLKMILSNCQCLESINIWCGMEFLNEKDALEVVAKYSPKNVYELKFSYNSKGFKSNLSSEELESFFTNWKNRTPMRSLSLIILNDYRYSEGNNENKENIKIIKIYIDLGIIKPTKFNDDDDKDDDDLNLINNY